MNIIVCGGRDYWEARTVFATLDAVHEKKPITKIIHGGARGADTLAKAWALLQPEVEEKEYPANWKAYGPSAGPIRNGLMLEDEDIDGVIAFPGGRGTADMVKQAKDAEVTIMEVK